MPSHFLGGFKKSLKSVQNEISLFKSAYLLINNIFSRIEAIIRRQSQLFHISFDKNLTKKGFLDIERKRIGFTWFLTNKSSAIRLRFMLFSNGVIRVEHYSHSATHGLRR